MTLMFPIVVRRMSMTVRHLSVDRFGFDDDRLLTTSNGAKP